MARKYETITKLYEQTIQTITATPENWQAFLNAACRNYKLSFDEQVLVYAQRPDATAVLEIEKWNVRFGRWVNRYATGIAVFDSAYDGQSRIKHYFDVSDTHESYHSRPVPIWTVRPAYEADVVESLAANFGELEDTTDFASSLISAAQNVAEDNSADYVPDLRACAVGSLLEELDDLNLAAAYGIALRTSVAHMLLARCGLDPTAVFDQNDYSEIFCFNTPDTVNALGVATGDIAKMVLSAIAKTVLARQRADEKSSRTFAPAHKTGYSDVKGTDKQPERGIENGTDLYDTGRLQPAESSAATGGQGGAGQVRPAPQSLSEAASQNPVHESSDERQAQRPLDGDRPGSAGTGGADHQPNGEDGGRDRAAQGAGSNALGGPDEQHPAGSGGSGAAGPDLQLKKDSNEKAGSDKLPALFDGETEQSREKNLPGIGAPHKPLKSVADQQLSLLDFAALPTGSGSLGVDAKRQIPTESLLGRELTVSGRRYHVDSVNEAIGYASLQDITFQEHAGFPIFRQETVPWLQQKIAEQKARIPAAKGNAEEKSIDEKVDAAEKTESVGIPAPMPPHPRRASVRFDLHPEVPQDKRHNYQIVRDDVGVGTPGERYQNNMAAIRLLKKLEAENRYATPDEQETLAQYVGWGGLTGCFDEQDRRYGELKSLLDKEEYAAARESTLTAFYTPPVVTRAIYKALAGMNFKTGNILEPSCGVGNFLGMLPEGMQGSKFYGSELDSISGRIAQQLYQQASIAVQGFEKTDFQDSFFDVAVGNVPFGNFKVADRRYDKNNFMIHDYFFARTLDKLRPGGLLAFVTAQGTMDKQNVEVRRYIAQRADLIGAIRLPNNTFKDTAGTEVTSDILFLQKRDRQVEREPDWVQLGRNDDGILMNRYFVDHPDKVMGKMQVCSGAFRTKSACIASEGQNLDEMLDEAVQALHAEITAYEVEEPDESTESDESIPADPSVRNFSYVTVSGKLYFRVNSRMAPVEVSLTAENRIRNMIQIRDCVRELIDYQLEDYSEKDIQEKQAELNRCYDTFVKDYGRINSRGNKSAFSEDSAYFLLASLEVEDDDGNFLRKADMFSKRTIQHRQVITAVDTAAEALSVSMAEKARVDIPYMAQLTGKKESNIIRELEGVIFRNVGAPGETGQGYIAADEYLSGNVREKLRMAKAKAEQQRDHSLDGNIKALEAVQPVDLTAAEIAVRLGATWLPPDVVEQFVYELFSTPRLYRATAQGDRGEIRVRYMSITGEWNIAGKSRDRGNIKALNTYGTKRINGYKIVEDTLNLRDVRIFDYVEDETGKRKPVLNKNETLIAQGKQQQIKAAFADWIWADPDRRARLCRIYNDKFNSERAREYDGSFLNFVGMNPEITLRPHQLNAVARIMLGGNTLLAHVVGSGKTYEIVAAAQESKRIGLCQKSLIVVPNHITEQWATEYLQLYPAANILVATKKDFEKSNRKRFCGRIATGDYDAVIIGHSQLEKIPMSLERQRAFLDEQLNEILDGISEIKKNNGEHFSVKRLERKKKAIVQKQEKLNDQTRKDDVVTFEELGVDRLYIDEAHYYKNLAAFSKMRNVSGISQTEAQKSSDLYMKCRYLDGLTDAHGTIFATGTPVSNSMVELFTMQKYLQYHTLQEKGLLNFDAWASTFGETITAIELAPEGTGYRAKTRFAKFYNLPELIMMFREVADIQTAETLRLPVPEAIHKIIALQPSEYQKEMVKALGERAEMIRNQKVDPSKDNMLCITNDGRKLALDQRLMNELLPRSDTGKTTACCENVYEIWERTKAQRSTQLIFSDLSTPHGDGKFNVYDDIKKQLIAKGIPAEEIGIIHDAKSEGQKKEMFGKVSSGKIRVLLGSTQKMGAGTNIQQKLIALHHTDCPWRPSDLQQREGRIVRQGNENPEVEIYSYVTESTFDAYLYQMVEAKQKFIGQIMTSKSPLRTADDIDETALSYAEIKSLATGNPLIKEKMDLDIEVQRLNILKCDFKGQQYELEDQIKRYMPQKICEHERQIAGLQADIVHLEENTKPGTEGFSPMTVKGVVYAQKKAAGNAIIEACMAMENHEPLLIGTYRGFSMLVEFEPFTGKYWLTLKNGIRHSVEVSADAFGMVQRLDNKLDGLPADLEREQRDMDNVKGQLANAKKEFGKPFPHEEELAEKSVRLGNLNVLLNMDRQYDVVLDGEYTEEESREKGREQCR